MQKISYCSLQVPLAFLSDTHTQPFCVLIENIFVNKDISCLSLHSLQVSCPLSCETLTLTLSLSLSPTDDPVAMIPVVQRSVGSSAASSSPISFFVTLLPVFLALLLNKHWRGRLNPLLNRLERQRWQLAVKTDFIQRFFYIYVKEMKLRPWRTWSLSEVLVFVLFGLLWPSERISGGCILSFF